MTPTVIFLHIGKTAGTTLRQILSRHYSPSETLIVRARPNTREETLAGFAHLPEAERLRPRLILGHTVFGIHQLVPRPTTYITMLRNPVSLVLSQYSFVRRTPGHRLHDVATDMSLEEYIRSGLSHEMSNSQTRAIAGTLSAVYGDNPSEMLELAKRNLDEHFAVIGLTERFDESLILLRRRFGWSKIHYVRANVTPNQQRPSPGTLDLIHSFNANDIALYEHARQRFDKRTAEVPGFEQEWARFKTQNSLYTPWGTLRYALPSRTRKAISRRFGDSR